jgi:lipoprotein-anchoring transpeptidase ErfK/SrfK
MIRFIGMVLVVISAIMILFLDKAKADVRILIDVSDQVMVVETPHDRFIWPVSTGREGYSTPTGFYKPTRLVKMHYSKKYDDAPMPNSIFFHEGYAIHATYDVKRLGRPASHGCVRLAPRDAQWLYQMVKDYGMHNTYIWVEE